MKKTVKIILVAVLAVLLLFGIAFAIYKSGLLVNPTKASLAKLTEVPQYDVMQWQCEREEEILLDYKEGTYDINKPYVIIDPYKMNPCSALVLFETDHTTDIEVTIEGDDDYSTIKYTKTNTGKHCEIPIIGLYAGRVNTVWLKDNNGNAATLCIKTEPLPIDFQNYKLEKSVPEKMEPGLTLFIACFEQSYSALLDHNAQIRGYLSNKYMAHGTSMNVLKNGNMLATGDEYKQIPYNMASLWEFNWLGKVFREYEIPNGVHHDFIEMPNGDILAVSNNKNMFVSGTREDVAIVLDRETGRVVREYDFRTILDETRDPYHHFHPNILNATNIDWMHENAVIYNQSDNSIIVSSPTQSEVVSINADTAKINWILGPHDGYEGHASFLKQYLLTPIGEDLEWQWCQHAPMILPDFDSNPDTIDLLMLDNGQSKSFLAENAVKPSENYSRAVQYRINQKAKTVEQIWQYGKNRGSQCYATFLGDADYLKATGNRLIAFGGQLRFNGKPVDDIVDGVLGKVVVNSRVVEVTEAGEVVFEVSVHDNSHTTSAETYQTERMPVYSDNSYKYQLGEKQGERVGESYLCSIAPEVKPPMLFGGKIGVKLQRICLENDRLIVDGTVTYGGKTYLMAKAMFVLRSKDAAYVYAANSGLNGRFFLSLDTKELKKGTYQLSIAGAVREGNDQLNGKLHQGHVRTQYKITVD